MPEKKTLENARRDVNEGKSPSTQAGEFVREEMEHMSERTRTQATRDYSRGQGSSQHRPSKQRSFATSAALRREGRQAASHSALSRQAHASARKRSAANRSQAARKAARTRARGR